MLKAALSRTLLIALLLIPAALQAAEVKLRLGELTLNAQLQKAGDNWPKGPVVLITHGTLAHNGMEIVATLQALFEERGISSLAINLSLGLDDRHGMYACKTPHRHKHTDALNEIGAWLGWLESQGVQQVVLLGHSRGGNQTAWFAAERAAPLVSGLVLIAPATWDAERQAAQYSKRFGKPLAPIREQAQQMIAQGQGNQLMEGVDFIYCQDTSATAAAFANYYALEPRLDTPQLLPKLKQPVLVFAGSEDDVVRGLEQAVAPLADGDGIRFEVIDGADHFFRDLYAEDLADISVEFIQAQ